jgi:hypothetical protein
LELVTNCEAIICGWWLTPCKFFLKL